MAWRRSSDKPLSKPMTVSLMMHKCVTRPQPIKMLCILYGVSGTLHVGDEIREINSVSVVNQTVESLQRMLVSELASNLYNKDFEFRIRFHSELRFWRMNGWSNSEILLSKWFRMMSFERVSLYRNDFRIVGPLCGNPPGTSGHWWIPPANGQ